MSTEDNMTIDERRKYLRRMKKRYDQANRKGQGRLLDEMELVTELHRKSLIRLLNGSLERQPRRRQRGRTYGPEVDDALRVISESVDYICPERLTPNLPWLASHLAEHGELPTSPLLLEQLECISTSTVGRILSRIRQDEPRLPRKGPRRANSLTRDIPMKRIPWNEPVPGHFEADLVHHCGPSASGEYVCTMQLIDVATAWSERRAVLGRSYLVVEDAFRDILARLPVTMVWPRAINIPVTHVSKIGHLLCMSLPSICRYRIILDLIESSGCPVSIDEVQHQFLQDCPIKINQAAIRSRCSRQCWYTSCLRRHSSRWSLPGTSFWGDWSSLLCSARRRSTLAGTRLAALPEPKRQKADQN